MPSTPRRRARSRIRRVRPRATPRVRTPIRNRCACGSRCHHRRWDRRSHSNFRFAKDRDPRRASRPRAADHRTAEPPRPSIRDVSAGRGRRESRRPGRYRVPRGRPRPLGVTDQDETLIRAVLGLPDEVIHHIGRTVGRRRRNRQVGGIIHRVRGGIDRKCLYQFAVQRVTDHAAKPPGFSGPPRDDDVHRRAVVRQGRSAETRHPRHQDHHRECPYRTPLLGEFDVSNCHRDHPLTPL